MVHRHPSVKTLSKRCEPAGSRGSVNKGSAALPDSQTAECEGVPAGEPSESPRPNRTCNGQRRFGPGRTRKNRGELPRALRFGWARKDYNLL